VYSYTSLVQVTSSCQQSYELLDNSLCRPSCYGPPMQALTAYCSVARHPYNSAITYSGGLGPLSVKLWGSPLQARPLLKRTKLQSFGKHCTLPFSLTQRTWRTFSPFQQRKPLNCKRWLSDSLHLCRLRCSGPQPRAFLRTYAYTPSDHPIGVCRARTLKLLGFPWFPVTSGCLNLHANFLCNCP
jgi:hypothetical protein